MSDEVSIHHGRSSDSQATDRAIRESRPALIDRGFAKRVDGALELKARGLTAAFAPTAFYPLR